jgi:hypothetical protein
MDILDEASCLSNFSSSELFSNSYIVYGLALLILVVISYFVYKYYFNKNNSIGSTNIEYLDTDENNQQQQQHQQNQQHQEQQYVGNNEN